MTEVGSTLQPELGGVVPFRVDTLPDDPDGQVAVTVAMMRAYALASATAQELQRDLETAGRMGNGDLLSGIHSFVRSGLQFRNDEATAFSLPQIPHRDTMVEVLVGPVDLSRAIAQGNRPAEDCDGFSMYVAALLEAAGIDSAFVTVAADPVDPSHYSHVYVVAFPAPDIRVPIDASHGHYAGWECPNRFGKRTEWPLKEQGHPFLVLGLLAAAALYAAIPRYEQEEAA